MNQEERTVNVVEHVCSTLMTRVVLQNVNQVISGARECWDSSCQHDEFDDFLFGCITECDEIRIRMTNIGCITLQHSAELPCDLLTSLIALFKVGLLKTMSIEGWCNNQFVMSADRINAFDWKYTFN